MALQGLLRIFQRHPAAIVANSDKAAATLDKLDLDLRSAGVDGILDELFDHGSRPLDDLARRNLVYRMGIEQSNLGSRGHLHYCDVVSRYSSVFAKPAFSPPFGHKPQKQVAVK